MNRAPNKNYDGAVLLRLTSKQIDIIAPGINLLIHSYKKHRRLPKCFALCKRHGRSHNLIAVWDVALLP